jgi:AsmA protein
MEITHSPDFSYRCDQEQRGFTRKKENFMRSRWVKIALSIVAACIVVIALIPLFVNADTFRPKVETELSSALGRKVTLGHLGLSIFSGSLVAENISIADDPAMSQSPFLEAKKLHIGIELAQFLFHHSIQITDITIDSPSINLIHTANGTWNFSNIGSSAQKSPEKPSTQQEGIIPALTIGELKIKGGSATISSLPATGKPFTSTDIDLSIQQFSFLKSFPFSLSAKFPGDGEITLAGNAGPVSQKDASDTPFDAKLKLTHFDPVAANVIVPGQGISMVADFDGQVASDGAKLTSKGTIQASKLQLARGSSPAPHPVTIDYNVAENLDTRTGQISDISVHSGTAVAHVNGGFRLTGQSPVLDLRLSAPNLPIDELEDLLPAFGITLPTGSRLRGGALTANLAITGPSTGTSISGPVEIDRTELLGFDLGNKIQGMSGLNGSKGSTQIEKVSTQLDSSPQLTKLSNIYGSVPAIGTAAGNGSVSPSGALDFQLVAKFNNASAVGSLANQGLNALGGLLGNRSNNAADQGVPLIITGTASNPSIRADMNAIIKQQAGGLLGQSSGQKQPSGSQQSNGQQLNDTVKKLKGLFGK